MYDFFLLAGVTLVAGLGFFGLAKSAIHENEGLISFLIAAVFLAGGAIVQQLRLG